MRKIKIPLLVVLASLVLAGIGFARDIPIITTSAGVLPQGFPGVPPEGGGLAYVGSGGPGIGDVLISPLYDVRSIADAQLPPPFNTLTKDQFTLISIVNTSDVYGVVGRLRFREWKRSVECLDFDIPLTTNDVWVAEVSKLTTGGAVIKSPDRYITNIVAKNTTTPFTSAPLPADGFPFRTFLITDETTDAAKLARCEYGYFEFIGEERVGAPDTTFTFPRVGAAPFVYPGRDVGNVMMGTVYILRPDGPISHQFNMTAIANFAIDAAGIYNSPLTVFPNLLNDVQGGPNPAAPLNPGWGGFDNLEALLSKRLVDFQYNTGIDPADPFATPTSTSVVVTFPTKWAHYNITTSPYCATPIYPFLQPFTAARNALGDEARTGACAAVPPQTSTTSAGEVVGVKIWDRAEHLLVQPTNPISPSPLGQISVLPWEVNVIGLVPSDPVALGFRNNVAIATKNSASGQTFYSGWGQLDLSPAVPLVTGVDLRVVPQGKNNIAFNFFNNIFQAYRGLPAFGVVMTEFFNNPLEAYYGNTVPWQWVVDYRLIPPDVWP